MIAKNYVDEHQARIYRISNNSSRDPYTHEMPSSIPGRRSRARITVGVGREGVVVSTYLIRMEEDIAFVKTLHALTLLWRA